MSEVMQVNIYRYTASMISMFFIVGSSNLIDYVTDRVHEAKYDATNFTFNKWIVLIPLLIGAIAHVTAWVFFFGDDVSDGRVFAFGVMVPFVMVKLYNASDFLLGFRDTPWWVLITGYISGVSYIVFFFVYASSKSSIGGVHNDSIGAMNITAVILIMLSHVTDIVYRAVGRRPGSDASTPLSDAIASIRGCCIQIGVVSEVDGVKQDFPAPWLYWNIAHLFRVFGWSLLAFANVAVP